MILKGINNVFSMYENRSMIPSLIPTPSKKQTIPVIQARKHPGSTDVKRRSGNAK
jgi:hypothetical protein